MEAVPAVIERAAGYTLDRSPVHHRATEKQTDTQPCTLTLTPRDNLESPINRTCIILDGRRMPDYLEKTHTSTGRTCKLHTERPQPGFVPGTLLV